MAFSIGVANGMSQPGAMMRFFVPSTLSMRSMVILMLSSWLPSSMMVVKGDIAADDDVVPVGDFLGSGQIHILVDGEGVRPGLGTSGQ